VVTKSVGTSNPYNMIRATFDALTEPDQPEVGGAASRQEGRRPAGVAAAAERGRGEADAEAIAE
jgi:small subunit ribosomal protein S5